jgi:phosphomannomutase
MKGFVAMTTDIRFGTDGWRAVIGADYTYDNVRRVADAAGRIFAADNPGGTVLVGFDTRFEAGSFAAAAAEVLAAHGLTVRVSDAYLPTPALCWSVKQADDAVGGVMLTASHNPSEYLGFKLRMADGGASPVEFTDRVEAQLVVEPPAARGEFETVDMVGPYLADLASLVDADAIRGANLRVVIDPLYGAGQTYLAETLRSLGVDVVEIHGERNPGFGGLHPEPIPPWIATATDAVRADSRDAGFVTDGDADRIGAIDGKGNFVSPHRIIGLMAQHLVQDKGKTGRVVKTLSTSVLVDRLARTLGLEVTTTPIGFKWIYDEMLKGDVLVGGEESGGIGLPDHVRERDGLLMALMLTEMMAQRGKGLGELVDDMLAITGPMEYNRVDLKITPEVKQAFLDRAASLSPTEIGDIPVLDIVRADGVKFLLADDAWLLLRPSGTEPLVRVYAEAPSAGVVDDLLAAGRALVEG